MEPEEKIIITMTGPGFWKVKEGALEEKKRLLAGKIIAAISDDKGFQGCGLKRGNILCVFSKDVVMGDGGRQYVVVSYGQSAAVATFNISWERQMHQIVKGVLEEFFPEVGIVHQF